MATKEQIDKGWEVLKRKFNEDGSCGSCGWWGLLSEHHVDDCDIEEAIDKDGIIKLYCVGEEDDCGSHRGIKIDILND